jgi:hypothetical protein
LIVCWPNANDQTADEHGNSSWTYNSSVLLFACQLGQ